MACMAVYIIIQVTCQNIKKCVRYISFLRSDSPITDSNSLPCSSRSQPQLQEGQGKAMYCNLGIIITRTSNSLPVPQGEPKSCYQVPTKVVEEPVMRKPHPRLRLVRNSLWSCVWLSAEPNYWNQIWKIKLFRTPDMRRDSLQMVKLRYVYRGRTASSDKAVAFVTGAVRPSAVPQSTIKMKLWIPIHGCRICSVYTKVSTFS